MLDFIARFVSSQSDAEIRFPAQLCYNALFDTSFLTVKEMVRRYLRPIVSTLGTS